MYKYLPGPAVKIPVWCNVQEAFVAQAIYFRNRVLSELSIGRIDADAMAILSIASVITVTVTALKQYSKS